MTDTYTDWTLVSLSPLSASSLAWITLVVVGATIWVLWSYRLARKRWGLMALRLLAALVVLAFVLEPALQLRVVRKIRNRLALVVDRSESMGLASTNNRSRMDNVRALVNQQRDALSQLQQSHIVEWNDLSGPITPTVLTRDPEGPRSDLVAALERAREAGTGRPLAGLVLFSDGADNADLESSERGRLSPAARRRLEALGAPVNTVDVSRSDRFRDVAITEILNDEFAFVHNTVEIEVELDASGFNSLTLPVTLRREADVIATQEIQLDGRPQRLVFSVKPDQIGEFVYSVSVPPVAGEAVTANNQRAFVMRVIRDKIRVLQVAGRPSWDERFLRQHLKENPNVDLISFFILRTPNDDAAVREQELSLIPFPTDKIFNTELHTFDVVIFQNFDYRPYRMERYLRTIRDAVRNGLGFVMLGGAQSFADGGYLGTELDEIVPLSMEDGGLLTERSTLALTEAGRRHPVTDLGRGSTTNEQVWQRVAPWPSLNRTAGVVAGATTLVVDPRHRDRQGRPLPVVAVMEAGEGRSLAVATDSMWRWRFTPRRDGGVAERAYHKFWSNALRWLVKDPESSRVRVLPSKRRFDDGEAVEVAFEVFGLDYQPVPFAQLRVTLEQSGGEVIQVENFSAGEGGTVRHRYGSLEPGAYRVVASASMGGERLGDGRGVFVIESRSIEIAQGAPRPDLLEEIARATGGRVLSASNGAFDQLAVVDPEVVEVDRRRNVELWDNGWTLTAALLLLGLEWALRRRRGYL